MYERGGCEVIPLVQTEGEDVSVFGLLFIVFPLTCRSQEWARRKPFGKHVLNIHLLSANCGSRFCFGHL